MAGMVRYVAGLLAFSGVLAQTPAPPDVVLRFDVDLVQVDAVVTDSHGDHIPGLKVENFEVLQDLKPQKITHFSHIAGEPSPIAAQPARSAPLVPAPAPLKGDVRRTIVFMLDDGVQMNFSNFHYAQEAVARYVEQELQSNDMAAIVRTSAGSGARQIFTSDAKWLHGVVEQMYWRPPLTTMVALPLLSALRQTIRALAPYPGRKSIVLISPGLPPAPPGSPAADYWYMVRQLADAANRASVTIETIDCRGLPTLQWTAADASMSSPYPNPRTGLTPLMLRSYNYFGSQDVLSFLAAMTAGRFQHENNDITAQVRNAAEDVEGYYLIGWYPGPDAFKSKPNQRLDYHRVKISLRNAKSLSVRTRDGFFAWPGDNTRIAYSPAQQMNEALLSPFRSGDIDVRLTASLGYDAQDGAYIQSLLHILPTGVDFQEVEGRPDCRKADIEVLTSPEPLDFDKVPTGRIDGNHARIQVCKNLDGILHDGIVVAVRNQIPVPGAYQMRAAVRNMEAGDQESIGTKGLIRRGGTTPEHVPIGSANQLIDVPDTRRQDMVLTGITLQSGQFQEPKVNGGDAYRIASPDDPAVRVFHAGETLTYSFRLLRSAKKSGDAAEFRVHILHDGKEIYAGEPRSVKPGEPVTRTYALDASAEAGHYLLGVSAGPATQWIDFDVKQ